MLVELMSRRTCLLGNLRNKGGQVRSNSCEAASVPDRNWVSGIGRDEEEVA